MPLRPLVRLLGCLLFGALVGPRAADAQTAVDSLRAELSDARAEGAPEGIAYAHNDLGLEALRLGDYETAVFHFDSARVLRSALPDTLAWARAANNLGVAHHQWGHLETALLAWEEAEALWRATGNDDGVATVLTNVGRLYDAWGADGRALETFEEAVEFARRDGDPALIAYTLQSWGGSLLDVGELDSAREAFDEAATILEAVEDTGPGLDTEQASQLRSAHGLVEFGRARLRLEEGDPAGAVPMLEALFVGPPEEAFSDRQGETLLVLADALSAAGDTVRAEVIYRRALDLARAAQQPTRQIRALEGLVALHSARGDTEAVADDLAEIAELRGALIERSTEERLVALEARGEADRANRENLALRRDLGLDRATLQWQRRVGLLGLGLFLSLGAFAAAVVYANRTGRRQRAALEQVNAELREAMSKVRTLERMIPICANCKRIRSDRGFWESVESYLAEQAGASFTHGICDDCGPKLYGAETWEPAESGGESAGGSDNGESHDGGSTGGGADADPHGTTRTPD